jgi:hypothetical protein
MASASAQGAPPPPNNDFAIAPASASNTAAPRAFFDLDVVPGQVITDQVTIANRGPTSVILDVYPSDAYNIPTDGSFALRLLKDPRTDVGSWVKLPTGIIEVPPNTQSTFPFEVHVPPNATPGDHAGGIVAVNTALSVAQNGPVQVGVNKAVGARIYARVKGPLRPSVQVTKLQVNTPVLSAWPLQHNDATVSYELVNSGNTRIDPSAALSVKDAFGRTVKRFPTKRFASLLPGQKATVVEKWSAIPALPLVLRPQVVVRAGATVTTRQGAASLVIPWLAILVVAALVAAWIWYRRRHRQTPAPPMPQPGPDREPVSV